LQNEKERDTRDLLRGNSQNQFSGEEISATDANSTSQNPLQEDPSEIPQMENTGLPFTSAEEERVVEELRRLREAALK
jgi:hypothetical protein